MRILTGLGLLAAVFAVTAVATPASAEFFGCNERSSTRTYTTKPAPKVSHSYTHTYSAQSRNYYRAGTTPPRSYTSYGYATKSHW